MEKDTQIQKKTHCKWARPKPAWISSMYEVITCGSEVTMHKQIGVPNRLNGNGLGPNQGRNYSCTHTHTHTHRNKTNNHKAKCQLGIHFERNRDIPNDRLPKTWTSFMTIHVCNHYVWVRVCQAPKRITMPNRQSGNGLRPNQIMETFMYAIFNGLTRN